MIKVSLHDTSREDGCKAFTLTNKNQLSVKVSELGASIVSICLPIKGVLTDITLHHNSFENFKNTSLYCGKSIGPNANRISDGRFVIDDIIYSLERNDGRKNLHSYPNGFDSQRWQGSISGCGDKVSFTYNSIDMEDGFPGNVKFTVEYSLDEDNALHILTKAISDKRTVFNPTNHCYFNLDGFEDQSIMDHEVTIPAESFVALDEDLLPTGDLIQVYGTPFDFRESRKIGERINEDNRQLSYGNGYDHCFPILGKGIRHMATAKSNNSGVSLFVYSDRPAVHLYTGNFITNEFTDDVNAYKFSKNSALCFETQSFTNAINMKHFEKPIIEALQESTCKTIYKFSF